MESLSPTQCQEMLVAVADAIIAAEPELSQADRDLGDGDHGLGMQRGMTAAKEALAQDFDTVDQPFTAVGKAMMSSMGGASGVVFGTLFRATGRALKGDRTLTARGLAEGLAAACSAISDRGGAKPGDKTMLDALAPAAEKAAEVSESPISQALAIAAEAATAGAEASKALIATTGRAKTLGERCLGLPDPGALSVALILRSMSSYAGN